MNGRQAGTPNGGLGVCCVGGVGGAGRLCVCGGGAQVVYVT